MDPSLIPNRRRRNAPPLSVRVERILEKAKTNQRHIERIFHKADQRHAKFSRIAMPVKILQSTFLD